MKKLSTVFRAPTLSETRARDILSAELALHEARLRLEREQATVAMYEASLTRMKAEHAN